MTGKQRYSLIWWMSTPMPDLHGTKLELSSLGTCACPAFLKKMTEFEKGCFLGVLPSILGEGSSRMFCLQRKLNF